MSTGIFVLLLNRVAIFVVVVLKYIQCSLKTNVVVTYTVGYL